MARPTEHMPGLISRWCGELVSEPEMDSGTSYKTNVIYQLRQGLTFETAMKLWSSLFLFVSCIYPDISTCLVAHIHIRSEKGLIYNYFLPLML